MAFNKSSDIKPFGSHLYLYSLTMHGDEASYMQEAYELLET